MEDFNPGKRWREVWEQPSRSTAGDRYLMEMTPQGWRYWVPEAPVPPLPTEPYTVIQASRQHLGPDTRVWVRSNRYWSPLGDHICLTDAELRSEITGFKVLAGPRAVTAKAVLDAFDRANWDTRDVSVNMIAREFGVKL